MDVTFTELFAKAKGDHRSVPEFAAECGYSAATFYRLSRGDFRRPLSDGMLMSIATHASEGSGITPEALLQACKQHIEINAISLDTRNRGEIANQMKVVTDSVFDKITGQWTRDGWSVSASAEKGNWDFVIEATRSEHSETHYYDVKYLSSKDRFRNNPSMVVNRTLLLFVGRTVIKERFNENTFYHLVFVAESEDLLERISNAISPSQNKLPISVILMKAPNFEQYNIINL